MLLELRHHFYPGIVMCCAGKGSSQDVSSSGLTPSGGQASPAAPRLLAQEREQWKAADQGESAERRRFDELLERALAQLEPMCLAEQKFCVSFFQLDVISPTNKVRPI